MGLPKLGEPLEPPWLFFSQNRVHSLELRALCSAWTAAPSAQQGAWGDVEGVEAGDPSAPLGAMNCPQAGASRAADPLLSPQGLAEAEADHWHPGRGSPVPPTGMCQTLGCLPGLPCHPACSFRAGVYYISRALSFDPSRSLTEQGGFREAGVVPVDSLASSSPCPLPGFQGVRLALPSPPIPCTHPARHPFQKRLQADV